MDEQAESALEPGGVQDLASFLSDTPAKEPKDDEDGTTADAAPDESDTVDEADDQADDLNDDEESDDEDDKTEPPPDRKIKVRTKDDDGAETEIEVSEAELASSYLRQSDYTKKTQALAERESQAVEFLKTKHDEVRETYMQQAEFTRAAVIKMAGIRDEAEMAQLASTDPAAWVSESQRQQSIRNFLGQLDQSMQQERQRAQEQAQQHRAASLSKQFESTWQELAKEKIDKPTLAKIYGDVNKTYGFSQEELSNVYDHRLVKMMRDASAYQALKSKAPEVTRKANAAPPMPNRQAPAAQTRKDQELNARFKSGRAKLNDLAALLR